MSTTQMFMLLPDLPPDTWGDIVSIERQNYMRLKKEYLALHLRHNREIAAGLQDHEPEDQEDANIINPLSQDDSVCGIFNRYL